MSENLYSGYKYSRPLVRRRGVLFFAAVAVLGAVIAVFAVGLALGKQAPRSASVKIEIPALEFSAVGTRGLATKSKALELARGIRERGGAGYVDFDFVEGEWFVLEEIGVGELSFFAEAAEVELADRAHAEIFGEIIRGFERNSLALGAVLVKPAREAAAQAQIMYGELLAAIAEFDKICSDAQNETYSAVAVAANKQLLALFLLSAEKDSEQISSAVKHCICSVKFAYLEMLAAVK